MKNPPPPQKPGKRPKPPPGPPPLRQIKNGDVNEATEKQNAIALDLYKVALAYEAWEAKLILDDRCWDGEIPRMTQELFDELVDIQGQIIKAMAKMRGKL